MTLQLLGNRVLVKPVADTTKETVSGIVLPDTSKRETCRGMVRDIGPGCRRIEIGKSIMFNPRVATEWGTDDGELLIMAESDILSVVE